VGVNSGRAPCVEGIGSAMTDTTPPVDLPESERPEPDLPELVESESLGADAPAADPPLKARVLLPFFVPLFAILIVAVLVLDISRLFLAGTEDSALVLGIVITLSILLGASLLAAAPRLKTASLGVILSVIFFVVSIASLVSLGPSLDTGEAGTAGFQYATGTPTSSVSVEALPSIKFNATAFTAKAGVVQFNYSGATGHTLAIQDPKFVGFLLTTDAGGKKTGKAKMTPGSYTLYCTVDSHEAQGMKATLTVSP
jgi:plastocyanin